MLAIDGVDQVCPVYCLEHDGVTRAVNPLGAKEDPVAAGSKRIDFVGQSLRDGLCVCPIQQH